MSFLNSWTKYPIKVLPSNFIATFFQAVSGKDAPHNNFFFYDGVSTSGVVQKITNISTEKSTEPKQGEQKMTSATTSSKAPVEEVVL